jgi:hypothetical protein
MTRRTYEAVCQLYEPLSALGVYREIVLESEDQPSVMVSGSAAFDGITVLTSDWD